MTHKMLVTQWIVGTLISCLVALGAPVPGAFIFMANYFVFMGLSAWLDN